MKVLEKKNFFPLNKDKQGLNESIYVSTVQLIGCILLGIWCLCIVISDNIFVVGFNEVTLKYFLAIITNITFLFYLPLGHWLSICMEKKVIRGVEFLENDAIEITLFRKKKRVLKHFEIIKGYEPYLKSFTFLWYKGMKSLKHWNHYNGVPYTVKDLETGEFYLFVTESES